MFVGIAGSRRGEKSLQDVSDSTLTDVSTSPFTGGLADRRPAAPTDSQIWVSASEQGSGKQTLNWEIEDGALLGSW